MMMLIGAEHASHVVEDGFFLGPSDSTLRYSV